MPRRKVSKARRQEFGPGGVELGGEQGPQGDRGGEGEHLVHQVTRRRRARTPWPQ